MTKSTNETTSSRNTLPSISIKFKNSNSHRRREEEDAMFFRVHKSLADERVYTNKVSSDRKHNDERVIHDHVASTVNRAKPRIPLIMSKKLKREDVKSSRIHETREDERVNLNNKFSLDRRFNDESVFDHGVASSLANLVNTRKPSKKLKEEDVKSSRVHETRQDEKNKLSLDRKFNDESVFNHGVASSPANLVKPIIPSKSNKLKEEDVKSSRVHKTLEDEKVKADKNNIPLDKKLKDQSLFDHGVASSPANLVKTSTPSESKKFKITLVSKQERRDNQEGRVESKGELFLDHTMTRLTPPNKTPTGNKGGHSHKLEVPDLTSYLPKWNVVDRTRDRLALLVPSGLKEKDEDVIKAAETLMMMRHGLRPSMAESSGNKRCLGFDLNEPPPKEGSN